MRLRRSFAVDFATQEVVGFLPENAPRRGEYVLVDGKRCKVVRCKVKWREPGVRTITKLRVREAAA